jgi:hypothetical protein
MIKGLVHILFSLIFYSARDTLWFGSSSSVSAPSYYTKLDCHNILGKVENFMNLQMIK